MGIAKMIIAKKQIIKAEMVLLEILFLSFLCNGVKKNANSAPIKIAINNGLMIKNDNITNNPNTAKGK